MNENLRPIKGFPHYAMDVKDGSVWSFKGSKRRVRGCVRPNGLHTVYLTRDNKKYCLVVQRLLFAVRWDVSYESIPQDLHVMAQPDGSLQLVTKKKLQEHMMEVKRAYKAAMRVHIMDKKAQELQIMRRYYESGDHSEVLEYALTLRDGLSAWFGKSKNVRADKAAMLFDTALERLIEGIKMPSSIVCSITGTMRGLMRKEYTKLQKTQSLLTQEEWLSILNNNKQITI